MKKCKFRRLLAFVLAGTLTISTLALVAGAANYSGDLDGDGKITAFDAQILAEARAGLRTLTDEQWAASGDLKPQDIIDFVLGK